MLQKRHAQLLAGTTKCLSLAKRASRHTALMSQAFVASHTAPASSRLCVNVNVIATRASATAFRLSSWHWLPIPHATFQIEGIVAARRRSGVSTNRLAREITTTPSYGRHPTRCSAISIIDDAASIIDADKRATHSSQAHEHRLLTNASANIFPPIS